MSRAWCLALCLLSTISCSPLSSIAGAAGPAADTKNWPAPDATLSAASAAMGGLQSLREVLSTRTYRDDALFLGLDAERAYVAPDRRYERITGRSAVDEVKGETVTIGPRFFKKVGDDGPWAALPPVEYYSWPANEYAFPGARNATWVGPDTVDGRPARVLVLNHEGGADQRNQGWQFQTRLWIDPETNFFLKRETQGQREEPGEMGNTQKQVQRYEATWTYLNHNASISISEPTVQAAP